MSGCQTCKSLNVAASFARGDLADRRRKFRRTRDQEAVAAELKSARDALSKAEARFEAHISDEHDGTPDLASPRTHGLQRYRGDKVPCPLCGKRVSATSRREHTSPSGYPCPGVAQPSEPRVGLLVDLPPVVIRETKRATDIKGRCRECGKWLPGERSLCGRCSVLRSA